MKVAEEWLLWADEKTVNLNTQKGMYPKIERDHGYNTNTKLFYCYYTHGSDDKSYSMSYNVDACICVWSIAVLLAWCHAKKQELLQKSYLLPTQRTILYN